MLRALREHRRLVQTLHARVRHRAVPTILRGETIHRAEFSGQPVVEVVVLLTPAPWREANKEPERKNKNQRYVTSTVLLQPLPL